MAIPELMWQADLRGPANFVVEGLGEIANSDPEVGEHLISQAGSAPGG